MPSLGLGFGPLCVCTLESKAEGQHCLGQVYHVAEKSGGDQDLTPRPKVVKLLILTTFYWCTKSHKQAALNQVWGSIHSIHDEGTEICGFRKELKPKIQNKCII